MTTRMKEQPGAWTTGGCTHCQRPGSRTISSTLEHAEFRMSEPTREGKSEVVRRNCRFWICAECRYTAEHLAAVSISHSSETDCG